MIHKEKIWWLEEKILGGMPKPPTVEDISALKEMGVGAVASFLVERDNLDAYEEAGLKVFWRPVVDDEAPTAIQAKEFADFAKIMIDEGLPLLVHCKGGNGRAGTMLAAYYISTGMTAEKTLNFMREINPRAVATKAQEDFLYQLKFD